MADGSGFFRELKRRHVWRVAVAYAIAGWLIVQIATQVFPFFRIPDWGVRLVVLLIVIGFPLVVAWSWIYEVTPEGIRRTAPAGSPEARETHDTQAVGRKLNTVIITVLVLAVALMGWRLLVLRRAPAPAVAQTSATARSPDGVQRNPGLASTSSPDSAAAAAASGLHTANAIPQKSVAVLPFTNESGKQDEQFFSDGLSEDLINALSQFAGLKVISRNSAFQFRGSKDSSAKIGQLLGVAHLLEGSVQRAGDTVRITATLVNASDGSTLWSEHYDKPYKDLFALQDAITAAVADALKAKLLTAPGAVVQSDRPPSGNLDAYNAYLKANSYADLGTESGVRKAIDFFNQAIQIDPHYAQAYAGSASMWLVLRNLESGADRRQADSTARASINTALALNPNLVAAHIARAGLLTSGDFDWSGGDAECRRALQLAPNDAEAKICLGHELAARGETDKAIDLLHQALKTNPRNAGMWLFLGRCLLSVGRLNEAGQVTRKAIELQPMFAGNHEQLAIIEIQRGDAKAALAAAQGSPAGGWRDAALALALQIGSDRAAADAALKNLIDKDTDSFAYQIAEVYALRRDPDNMFKWLDRAWTNRDSGISRLLYDPFILRYEDDPRFVAFCKKVGLPTTTDAVAMR